MTNLKILKRDSFGNPVQISWNGNLWFKSVRKNRNKLRRDYKRTTDQRFNDMVDRSSGHWIWNGVKKDGKPHSFYYDRKRNGKILTTTASRWSYIRYKGSIPDSMFVVNTCGIVDCVNPDHLTVSDKKKQQAKP